MMSKVKITAVRKTDSGRGHTVCYDAWSLSILYNFGNFAGRNLITKL